MAATFRDRLWAILILLCITVSFCFVITLHLLGWETALLAIVVGLIAAMAISILTTPRN